MAWIEGEAAGAAPLPAPDETEDLTLAPVEAPPPVAAQSAREYFRAYWVKIKGGDAGVLPVVGALVLVFVTFWYLSPGFLSPYNLVSLLEQSAVYITLAMAECFVLLLGEIDLSVGFTAAVGGMMTAVLVQGQYDVWWPLAIAAGIGCGALIGLLQGLLITRLRLPSFIVTLSGSLALNGILLMQLGDAVSAPLNSPVLQNQQAIAAIVGSRIPVLAGWIGLAVVLAIILPVLILRDEGRRRSGLVAPPRAITLLKVVGIAAAGIAVVWICSINRTSGQNPIEGVPYFIPIVLVVFLLWMVLLEQTPFGRYVYAVGGNAEAARRAGIPVPWVRTVAFVLCSSTAALGGIIYASQLGSMAASIQAGSMVLYAVAGAVIGGTSLFGGRGRVVHGVLGGLAIGAIYNGTYALGLQLQWQLIITSAVLIIAVTIDSFSRRGSAPR